MASRRMVPTNFFKDPDIMNLGSKETQLILIGLILLADDEGRAVAHAGLLGREMDYPVKHIEAALEDLVDNDLLVVYQAGKHRYYQLTRWSQWQTLGGRLTPSRYPAPPVSPSNEAANHPTPEHLERSQRNAGEDSGNDRGNSPHFPDQENPRELNQREGEGKEPSPDEFEPSPGKVVPFPSPPDSAANADGLMPHRGTPSDAGQTTLARQVAHILRLPVSDALLRLVADYAPQVSLSVLGEADAAREWIDDPQRNKQRKRMSPAFFRTWLKREMEAVERRQHTLQALTATPALATGTDGGSYVPAFPHGAKRDRPLAPRSTNLMYLAEEDAVRAACAPAPSALAAMRGEA